MEEFVLRRQARVSPFVVQVLATFTEPRSLREAARLFPGYRAASVVRELSRLARLGFLARADRAPREVAALWKGSFAAAAYHFATRNVPYLTEPEEQLAFFRARLAEERQPPLFKDYRGAPNVALPATPSRATLASALAARRTHREFARTPVTKESLATILSGAFGRTGWLDAAILGRKLARTSPSAGARHPIECYVLAWNVAGLARGVYHFSVRRNALERLDARDPRRAAAAFASGQTWVARAAFLCVLTAVAPRTFWKYPSSDAYRLFLLDAAHLAQTFLLLAAGEGLGGFVTAALQEDLIERRLRLDGVTEFPVYLCGAGMPITTAAPSGSRGASGREPGTSRASRRPSPRRRG